MKKILVSFFLCVCTMVAGAVGVDTVEYAPVANLEYIHNSIASKYDITVPYNSAADIYSIANMKYLLTTIDVANQMQGNQTDYGTGEFATEYAVNTITVDTAIDTLIKIMDTPPADSDEPEPGDEILVPPYVFAIKTSATDSFEINIAAKGTFTIDWGDGTVETYNQTSSYTKPYSHKYADSGPQTIRFAGQATEYYSSYNPATISFSSKGIISEIIGSLGKIFPTLADGSQPSFYQTFSYASNVTRLPKKLFSGITGKPISSMFYQTFYNMYNLTEIPENLFGGLDGAPGSSMFYQTFYNCSSVKSLPNKLFGNLYGTPAMYMFYGTFYNCTGLTGEIPLGFFGDFENNIKSYMFGYAFYNCNGLTGPSARMPDGTYIYNYFTKGTGYYPTSKMYYNCTGLSDYSSIPSSAK
ncbi:MAG: hypothetical protein ACLRFP_03995 [Alphaproteobacteria bacterium]